MSTALWGAAPPPHSFNPPVVFEPNHGQAPKQVRWIARTPGYMLFITGDGATMILRDGSVGPPSANHDFVRFKPPQTEDGLSKPEVSAIRMKLTGSHPWDAAVGLEPTGGVSNYLLGSDPNAWVTNVPHYSRVRVPGVYDGVDLVFYSKRNQLEYDFVVAAGADPQKIQLAFEGTDRLRLDQTGDLVLTAAGGSEIRHVSPHVYQQSDGRVVEVASGYELLDSSRASFTLASYDKRNKLIIDPTVSFTRFLSGNSEDIANGIATDSFEGNAYVTGGTLSTANFPISGALQANQRGSLDAFLTKLDPNGNIIFSTYWGGMASDVANAIAVDSTGIYITGNTLSSNFPGGHNLPANNASDLFVTKFPLSGNTYIYSFVNGGSSYDSGQSIAVDAQHQAYITGYTYSANFPKIGAGLTNFYGTETAFLMKVSPMGTITNSMYLGGSGGDVGYGIAVDNSSSPWITGATCSADFPETVPSNPAAGCNAFVTRLNSALNQYEFSARFGGQNSRGQAIAVNGSFGYVTGTTYSNFPTTAGAFQRSIPNTKGSAFVMKLGYLGDLWYATYLGASDGSTNGTAIVTDREDNVYVSGATSSAVFPGAPALKPNPTAGFVTKLNPELSGVDFTTLLGASVNALALFYPAPSVLVPPQIYTAGQRYTGGLSYTNLDAFVVKLTQ